MRHYNKIEILDQIAKEAMTARGLLPEFPQEVIKELEAIQEKPLPKEGRDLRSWLFFSIDNEDSRDLDQLTFAENNRIFVAIADVNAYVRRGAPIDGYARHNTTSVYTPTRIFPMLPLKLSNGFTSLNQEQDRSSFVVELEVTSEGKTFFRDVYPALVRNHAKLAYPHVARWLEQGIPLAQGSQEIHQQLLIQDELAQRILKARTAQGALGFETVELKAIIEEGIAVGLSEREENRAQQLIENFMIAANVALSEFCMKQGLPLLRRIVRVPKRWKRIVELAQGLGARLPAQPDGKALRDFLLKERQKHPEQFPDLSLSLIKLLGRGEYVLGLPGGEGHFDLALRDYAHTTAPNRRYPDLVMQRIVKSYLLGERPPYTPQELLQIARRCTEKEEDAVKVERCLIKCAAAMVLMRDLGREFSAIVTGASLKGTWVRLSSPRVEGKLIKGEQGVDVGDHIRVKLIHVDVRKGHIDFARIG